MPGPYSIEFGVFSISYFALIVVAAVIAGWAISLYRARRRGKPPIVLLDALVLLWLLGGRLRRRIARRETPAAGQRLPPVRR